MIKVISLTKQEILRWKESSTLFPTPSLIRLKYKNSKFYGFIVQYKGVFYLYALPPKHKYLYIIKLTKKDLKKFPFEIEEPVSLKVYKPRKSEELADLEVVEVFTSFLSRQKPFKNTSNYVIFKATPELKKFYKLVIYDLDDDKFRPVIEDIIDETNKLYYIEGKSYLTDKEWDTLYDLLKYYYPDSPLVKSVGVREEEIKKVKTELEKVELPVPMGSLSKVKEVDDIKFWLKDNKIKGDLIITPKYDGLSLLVCYKNGYLDRAFTRGSGTIGLDITEKVKHMKSIHKKLNTKDSVCIRGEVLIDRNIFESKYKEQGGYANPRNFVAGVMNTKETDVSVLQDIDFVAYEVMSGRKFKNKEEMIKYLKKNGFNATIYLKVTKKDLDKLTDVLLDYKANLPYLVDGLVIEPNDLKYREKLGTETNSINPKWARAYKPSEVYDVKVATVAYVEWNMSKRGLLKPVVVLKEPVEFDGVKVWRATGHNYQYIKENKIGKNAKIELMRSGDVIPYIVKVVKPAKKPDIPEVCPYCGTKLEVAGVDLYCPNPQCEGKTHQRLFSFFRIIGVEYISEGWLRRFIDAGYDTVGKILGMTYEDFLRVFGVAEKLAEKFEEEIQSIREYIDLPTLMYASGFFSTPTVSLGYRRLKEIVANFGEDVLKKHPKMDKMKLTLEIAKLPGFSLTLAKVYADNIGRFYEWYKKIKKYFKEIEIPKIKKHGKLKGMTFVFTGFRDRDLEEIIEENGGRVSNSVSHNTTIVIYADTSTTKYRKAKELGVKTMTRDEFIKWLKKKGVKI